jgi:hypothetical protein
MSNKKVVERTKKKKAGGKPNEGSLSEERPGDDSE